MHETSTLKSDTPLKKTDIYIYISHFVPKNSSESDDDFPFWVWWKSPVDFQAVQVDHFSFRPTVGPPQWNQQSATNGTAWILGLSAEKIWKNAGKNVGLFVWRIQWIRHVPYRSMGLWFLFICRQQLFFWGTPILLTWFVWYHLLRKNSAFDPKIEWITSAHVVYHNFQGDSGWLSCYNRLGCAKFDTERTPTPQPMDPSCAFSP